MAGRVQLGSGAAVLLVDVGDAVVVGVDFFFGFGQPVLAVSGAEYRGGQYCGYEGRGEDADFGMVVRPRAGKR